MEIVQVSPPPVFVGYKLGIDSLPKGLRVRVGENGSLSLDIRGTEISTIPSGLKGIGTIFCRQNQIKAVARSYKGKIEEVSRLNGEIVRRPFSEERMDLAHAAFEKALHYNPIFQKLSYIVVSSLFGGQKVESRLPSDLKFSYDKDTKAVTLDASKTVLKTAVIEGVSTVIMPNSQQYAQNSEKETTFADVYGRRHTRIPEERGIAKATVGWPVKSICHSDHLV